MLLLVPSALATATASAVQGSAPLTGLLLVSLAVWVLTPTGVGALTTVTASQATSGNSFSFANSYTVGDTIPTSAPTVGEVPAFGDVTSTAGGTAGNLAGTITTAGAVTVTAGGANTSAIGQVISELTTR